MEKNKLLERYTDSSNRNFVFRPHHPIRIVFILILIGCCICFSSSGILCAGNLSRLVKRVNDRDAILVADSQGRVLFSRNANKKLIPASVLKILTSLAALHYLGSEFRFITEFYQDPQFNLKVKGYGDPLLISEVLPQIAAAIHTRIDSFNNLILDGSYFEPIVIPGVTSSLQPYDAPNGALCVNFNTVYYRRNSDGSYASAETQTPLLPFVMPGIRKSPLDHGRIILSQEKNETTLYAGHLFLHFLEKEGITSKKRVKLGSVHHKDDRLVYRYQSVFSMEETITRLLDHSNNFVANQLFVATGVKAYGPPGNLEKGVRAVRTYSRKVLGAETVSITEGSGISRANRLSATDLHKILEAFEPYFHLLPYNNREFYKTGTLNGIRTRVGYMDGAGGKLYRFVVLLNTPGKTTEPIMDELRKMLE